MLEACHRYFAQASEVLGLSDKVREILITPRRVVKVDLVIEGDDGRLLHRRGFRVQHSDARGPFKGGLRYHPSMDEEHAAGLANLMTWKTALVDVNARSAANPGALPIGGHRCPPGFRKRGQFRWEYGRVTAELEKTMVQAYTDVLAIAKEKSLNLRTAAFVLGVRRVMRAALSRRALRHEIKID